MSDSDSDSPAGTVPDTLDQGFIDRVRAVRMQLRRTQPQMDQLLRIGKKSWQRYENGVKPGSLVIAKLVHLGFDANWVLTGHGGSRLPRIAESAADYDYGGKRRPSLDPALVKEVVAFVEKRLGATADPARKAELIVDMAIERQLQSNQRARQDAEGHD
ncbi:MAG: helix-turn-helix transcriptional regulator [Wenzhouxiangellaceae bacterium]